MDPATREWQLLQALCQTTDVQLRRRALTVLPRLRWASNDHRVLFEAWAALTTAGTPIRCETVASEATRSGFPDLDFDSLFMPLVDPARSLASLLDQIARDPEREPPPPRPTEPLR